MFGIHCKNSGETLLLRLEKRRTFEKLVNVSFSEGDMFNTKNHSLEEFRGNVSLRGEMFTNSDIHCPPLRGNIAYLVMSGGNLSSVESNLAYQRGTFPSYSKVSLPSNGFLKRRTFTVVIYFFYNNNNSCCFLTTFVKFCLKSLQ